MEKNMVLVGKSLEKNLYITNNPRIIKTAFEKNILDFNIFESLK